MLFIQKKVLVYLCAVVMYVDKRSEEFISHPHDRVNNNLLKLIMP